MDEPASALDPIATQRIEELVYQLKTDYTIVIVTHNMQQAARVSDQHGVLLARTPGRVRPDRSAVHEPGREADRGLRDWKIRIAPPSRFALRRDKSVCALCATARQVRLRALRYGATSPFARFALRRDKSVCALCATARQVRLRALRCGATSPFARFARRAPSADRRTPNAERRDAERREHTPTWPRPTSDTFNTIWICSKRDCSRWAAWPRSAYDRRSRRSSRATPAGRARPGRRRADQPVTRRDRRTLLQAAGAPPADGGGSAVDRLGGENQHRPRTGRRSRDQHRGGRAALHAASSGQTAHRPPPHGVDRAVDAARRARRVRGARHRRLHRAS